jgi:hypothetical protein
MGRFALAAALVSFVSTAAYAQDVKTDFDKNANFGGIKAFAVEIGTSWNNPIGEKRVTDKITQTLTEKGWTKTDANIIDAKSKQLMFRGPASDEISDKQEKNVKKLDKAISKMFKDFPPGSKEKK